MRRAPTGPDPKPKATGRRTTYKARHYWRAYHFATLVIFDSYACLLFFLIGAQMRLLVR